MRQSQTRRVAATFLPQRTLRALAVMALGAVLAFTATAPAAADQPVNFMRKVAKELMAASKTGSRAAVARVIARHGDVPAIGLFSLGSYSNQLSQGKRNVYYAGMTRFMARYLMDQKDHYKITRVAITGPSTKDETGYEVVSDVTLQNGSVYDVRWKVVRRGRTYKVRDAQVLGFWLTALQRQLFRGYIAKHNDNVNALLYALGS